MSCRIGRPINLDRRNSFLIHSGKKSMDSVFIKKNRWDLLHVRDFWGPRASSHIFLLTYKCTRGWCGYNQIWYLSSFTLYRSRQSVYHLDLLECIGTIADLRLLKAANACTHFINYSLNASVKQCQMSQTFNCYRKLNADSNSVDVKNVC